MTENHKNMLHDDREISFLDIARFLKKSRKKIFSFAAAGVIAGLIIALTFGSYKASLTLINYADLTIPEIKYFQAALPRLGQENQHLSKNEEDDFLASEKFWQSAVKSNFLISKADGKELLDATSLKDAGSKVSAIEISGTDSSKEEAERKTEKITKFFIDGSTFIATRDLIKGYQRKVLSTEGENKKKVAEAKLELAYLQKKIENLIELKSQYPSAVASVAQVVDAKDSGAKFLPITTQIVAATTDANALKESLERYKDIDEKRDVYKVFIEKANLLMEKDKANTNLTQDLLAICDQIRKKLDGSSVQTLAVQEIKTDVLEIQKNMLHGLTRAGDMRITKPRYWMYIWFGLLSGLFLGLLVTVLKDVNTKIKVLPIKKSTLSETAQI